MKKLSIFYLKKNSFQDWWAYVSYIQLQKHFDDWLDLKSLVIIFSLINSWNGLCVLLNWRSDSILWNVARSGSLLKRNAFLAVVSTAFTTFDLLTAQFPAFVWRGWMLYLSWLFWFYWLILLLLLAFMTSHLFSQITCCVVDNGSLPPRRLDCPGSVQQWWK